MLKSVTVERFKSVERAEVKLGRITLLVGPNNAGKSSLLQAIQFGVSVAQSLSLDGATWSIDEMKGTLSTQQLVYTPLRDVQALAHGGKLRQEKATAIHVIFLVDDGSSTDVAVRLGRNKNIAVNIVGKSLGVQLQNLEQPFSVVAPGLAGIPSVEEYKTPGIVQRAAAKGDANNVFRNVLWTLRKDPPAWKAFCNSLKEVFHDLEVDVEFNHASDENISAVVVRDGYRLPIDSVGTGVLQAIQVLAYIGVYKPRLLILDEPDSHLHPDNQRKLAVRGDFQVLVSTHSRHFLEEFGALDAVVHWFSDGSVQQGDFNRVSALLELGALDAGDRLRNGLTNMVVITEDSDHRFLRAMLGASGWNENSYSIWSYATSSQIRFAQVLGEFIQDHAPGTTVVVHRDRDFLDDQEVAGYRLQIEGAGLELFVTNEYDMESAFLAPDHLDSVFPELNRVQIEDLLLRATAAVRAESIAGLIDHRVRVAEERRRAGDSAQPHAGTISAQAEIDFDSNPHRFRNGKRTLKAFRRLLSAEHRMSRNEAVPSPALAVETFKDLHRA
jgi:energy-coupling factor transporter ATP-binding protein EcfA2